MSGYKIDLPWKDASKWKPGFWYPMPFGNMTNRVPVDLWICEGWDIYEQAPGPMGQQGDIICALKCADCGAFTFSQAVAICEAHNKRPFKIRGKRGAT